MNNITILVEVLLALMNKETYQFLSIIFKGKYDVNQWLYMHNLTVVY